MGKEFTYYAFISYNHRDEKWAKRLQYKLHHYRLPAIARKEIGEDVRIRPVFRYVSNLSLGDLKSNLSKELEESKYLIVICSPNSAQPNIRGEHWVNDEINRFIALGRKNRIIPVIVAGTPNSGDVSTECFPPALRTADIAGADLSTGSRAERRDSFLKIVAKLLELKPDQLIRLTEREDRRHRVVKWLCIAPILLLGVFGGLFAIDSNRTVKNYYADYVDSFGLPEGIFPLKKSDTTHRNVHYRFEYCGFQLGKSPHADSADWCIWKMLGLRRRLVRVVQANSHGLPCKRWQLEYDRPQMQDFTYDNKFRLCEIRYGRYNGEGREPYLEKRIELSTENGVVNGLLQFFSSEGRLDKAYAMASTTESDDLFSAKSEITQHVIKRDPRGRVEQRLFLNLLGANVPDGDGLYGFGYEYDDFGRQTAQWYLHRDGNEFLRHPNKKGVAGVKYEYHERNMRKIEYVNQNGSPVIGPHGWMVIVSDFDKNDNVVKTLRYDERRNRICGKGCYAEERMEYDECGNMTKVKYLGIDGKLTLVQDGYAELRCEYDTRGNQTKESYFDVDGKPTLHKNGCVAVLREYDACGNETRRQYLGVDGSPALIQNGYAELRCEYDTRGNQTKESYFGVDGKPILLQDGYAAVLREYDTRGNETKTQCLGVDGKPTLTKYGSAAVLREYDARGNETSVRHFGVDGKPTLTKDGCAEVRNEYDVRGNLTKGAYFDVDGKPILLQDGRAEFRCEYDARGNVTRMQLFGVDGKPTLVQNGYAELRCEYDTRGNLTK